MITALLLFPVVSLLLWLYWYCLPKRPSHNRRWRWMDTVLLFCLGFLAYQFIQFALHAEYEGAGPMWPELVSAVGVYAIFAIGLATGLGLRRVLAR